LIGGGGSPIIGGFVGLRASELACKNCDGDEEYGFRMYGFRIHGIYLILQG